MVIYMNPLILNNLNYGMFAIGVKDEKRASACIVNIVAQISREENGRIAMIMGKDNYSSECIKKNKYFTVSILSEDTPGSVIGALGLVSAKNGTDKLKNIRHKVLIEGVPVIKENVCCWFLCKLDNTVDSKDQTVFIADIIAGSDYTVGKPMTYEYYREKLGGSAPMDSPIYIKPQKTFDSKSGESFICSVCGYVYNDPNFSFGELAEDWRCPVCKVSKKAYIRNTKNQ